MFSLFRTVQIQVRFEFKWNTVAVSGNEFSYFLVKILCFTDKEIEAQSLGRLSDLFNVKRNRIGKRIQNLSIVFLSISSAFYLILHYYHWL